MTSRAGRGPPAKPGCHQAGATCLFGLDCPPRNHPCRSSTQRTSSCCAATTSAPRSTESTDFMMSASGGTTSGFGRPSQTASTACRWRRWWMRRCGAFCCWWLGRAEVRFGAVVGAPPAFCASAPACLRPAASQPQSAAASPSCCLCCRSSACMAACRRSSSPWSRSSGSRGPQMCQTQGCSAICCGQTQTRMCRQAEHRLARMGLRSLVGAWPACCKYTVLRV